MINKPMRAVKQGGVCTPVKDYHSAIESVSQPCYYRINYSILM